MALRLRCRARLLMLVEQRYGNIFEHDTKAMAMHWRPAAIKLDAMAHYPEHHCVPHRSIDDES